MGITYNERNSNRNKLLKVQLLLKELFIVAVNKYMFGTVNASMGQWQTAVTQGGLTRRKALFRMGAFIAIGALIDKNTLEGGHLLEGGC